MRSQRNTTIRTRRMVGRLLAVFGSMFLFAAVAGAKTIIVTNANDSGAGSLRQAIIDANNSLNPDTINFDIPGVGAHTINLFSRLPEITDPVTINGFSQPGAKQNTKALGSDAILLIELNGAGAGALSDGLILTAGDSLVRGLVINRFNGNAIALKFKGGNIVNGCFLGLTVDGTVAQGNRFAGVEINRSNNNLIGGTLPAARNVISGNSFGIDMVASQQNVIENNYIGTDALGQGAAPNSIGILVNSSFNNRIGDIEFEARNVISGNAAFGIQINESNDTVVSGNFIGTDFNGGRPLGNGAAGVEISAGSDNNIIGGVAPGARNIIAFNGSDPNETVKGGVSISSELSTGNQIISNPIHSNGGPGINLFDAGGSQIVTQNDLNDLDTGANNQQNFPVIIDTFASTDSSSGVTNIVASLNSGPGQYRIDFFFSGECDPSGHGEGESFLVSKTIQVFNNDSVFSFSVPFFLPNKFITATATDSQGNTSEFSQCLKVTPPPGPAGIFSFGAPAFTIGEQGKSVTIAVIRTSGSEGNASVDFATIGGGTATPDVDFQTNTTTVNFADGETSKQVPVGIINDALDEPDETVNIDLSNPTGGAILGSQKTTVLTILDDDAAPPQPGAFEFSKPVFTVSEEGGVDAVITVLRKGGVAGDVSVDFATSSGTATSIADFGPTNKTLNFANNTNAFQVLVSTNADSLDEPDESYNLTLSNPTGGATLGTQKTAIVTILDDDAPPLSLSVGDASVQEGNNGTASVNFNVTLSEEGGQSITVNFATQDGSAQAGSDYQLTNNTVTFAPGETSKQVSVPVNGDTTQESDETFTVALSNPSNATINKAQATGTIINDDAASTPTPTPDPTPTPTPTPDPTPTPGQSPTVQFSAASYQASESDNITTINVTRTGDASQAASVDYATTDITASERGDYTTALGTLRFAAGETTKTFDVLLTDDSFVEADEQVQLTLSNASGGGGLVLGNIPAATLTIKSDAVEPALNSIDNAQNFVRQHYHDFLNREPDAAGLAFWTNEITSCGADAACVDAKRENVSAAFFLSIEFSETGYLVARYGQASFGKLPRFREFLRDSQEMGRGVVIGQPGADQRLEQNKQDFTAAWVARPEFDIAFGAMSEAQFVDALFTNAGVTPTQAVRDALVGGLQNQTDTRAGVLRQVAEYQPVAVKLKDASFVLMQYVGYLRRNPDDAPDFDASGFNFWLGKLDAFGGDFQQSQMVKAFLVSGEYRSRFGQP